MSSVLPFLVEYAKTGRASCKACKSPIAKDSLRIAKVVQSPFHDGTMTNWFHDNCFFTKAKPKQVGDIANFENIRWEDQEKIKSKIEGGTGQDEPSSSGGKGRKRPLDDSMKEFKLEYAKSNRSICLGCEAPIIKGDVRISKMDYDSEKAALVGGIDRWHHVECFVKLRESYRFFAAGSSLPGFKVLSDEDKATIKKSLPKVKETDIPPEAKKLKTEPIDHEVQQQIRQQNERLFQFKDELSKLKRKELLRLLTENNQCVPTGLSEMADHLSDLMAFGNLGPCSNGKGKLRFMSGVGYKCTSQLSEWSACDGLELKPKRTIFQIPNDLKDQYDFLKNYKCEISDRIFTITEPSISKFVKKEEVKTDSPRVDRGPLPLKGMQFVIAGRTKKTKDELKKEIMLLGGTVTTKVHEHIAAVIASEDTMNKAPNAIEDARTYDIQIVTEDFVDEAKDYSDAPIILITKKNIADWGGDPSARVSVTVAKSSSHGKSIYEKKSSGKVKLRVKGGGAVDPESGLEDTAHVYERGNEKFTVTLGLTDIQTSTNKYYKLQILKHDVREKYWLFRNWGRIGTTIGGHLLDDFSSRDECIKKFMYHYKDKTGNLWSNRSNFEKKPGLMYPMDVEEADPDVGNLNSDIESKLEKPVQNLMKLIFDIGRMKQVMKEYELDSDKMPLGKLSKLQLQKAYQILTELQEAMKQSTPAQPKIIDATNRFYTLVPHSFGVSNPPLLDNTEIIKAKCEMIDALMEMEIAYNLLSVKVDSATNPIDSHYAQLNTNIEVLDKNSEEFKMIEKYTKNTHASTHSSYELEVEQVFIVKRQGEDKRFKPFKKLPNRKLLWHGSRTTNFAGILSQGLRIAPPEAPVTGYMFGKGIYFADMVSKSANYCCTNRQDSTGLLLLCDVALGEMYERLQSDYIEKLPKGKHSCFGMGQTCPDPKMSIKLKDGVEVPCGTPIDTKLQSSLLYNEFIVYDIAQVQVQYLVRMNFNYKY